VGLPRRTIRLGSDSVKRIETVSHTSILLRDYLAEARLTDRFPPDELQPILLGLFGETGGIMSASKKHKREGKAFIGYQQEVEEEFGDTLWYFAALCRRVGAEMDQILAAATENGRYVKVVAANDLLVGPLSDVASVRLLPPLDDSLLNLGRAAADLMSLSDGQDVIRKKLVTFADCYLHALQAGAISFARVVQSNLAKIHGRFLPPDTSRLPTFDSAFPEDERLPLEFEIAIRQRKNGQSFLQWNGVFIGDPLTDSIRDADGYRFHDVFHLAHAAILHWSPTFRALIKHKRKSDPFVDEAQDGGRAIVVEEGLSAWLFSRAKLLNFFDGQESLSFDLLKTIGQFVSGYEVEVCPLKLWEEAVLQGYAVFREVRARNGGIVVGNRASRTIIYRPL
jgi:NTP pyrophosphatase (non-canonical NTP hydrolase)